MLLLHLTVYWAALFSIIIMHFYYIRSIKFHGAHAPMEFYPWGPVPPMHMATMVPISLRDTYYV